MNLLSFRFKIWKLKRQYFKYIKIKKKYTSKILEKKKFVNFFIKDEEDKNLNKNILENFDKNIQKFKLKLYKRKNKIDKLLFSLKISDLDYIFILYKYKVSDSDCEIIKEILFNNLIMK